MKEDGCGRIGDEGENLDEDERIFCFEEILKFHTLWMV
jgi:hypothetical protein